MTANVNSILYGAGVSVRDHVGTSDLFATKVDLSTLVDQEISGAILALNNRMALLEGGGGTQTPPTLTASPVSWTNISEIGISGEKLLNTTFLEDTINSGDVRRVTNSWSNSGGDVQVGDLLTLINTTTNASGNVSYKWSRATSVEGTYPIGTRFVMITTHGNKGLNPGDTAIVTGLNPSGFYTWSGNGSFKPDEEGTTWRLADTVTLEEQLQSPYVSVTFNKVGDNIESITADNGTALVTYTASDPINGGTPNYDQQGVVNGNFTANYWNHDASNFLDIRFGENDVQEITLIDNDSGNDIATLAYYTEDQNPSNATKSTTTVTDIFYSNEAQATNQTERVSLNYGLAPNMYPFVTFTNENALGRKVKILTQSLATTLNVSLDDLHIIDNINPDGNRVHISAGWLDHESRGSFGRVRGVDWEFVQVQPDNWSVVSGEIDETALALGLIDGISASVVVQQTLASPIPGDTTVTVQINRPATQPSGETKATFVYNDGSDAVILDNQVSNTTTITIPSDKVLIALKVHTMHNSRQIESVSLVQGSIAGGEMEVSGNSIEKIGGSNEFNAGASSAESIPGGQDGYFQFQYGGGGHVAIGLTYEDAGFGLPSPAQFTLNLLEQGTVYSDTYNSGEGFAPMGTWLRIRHYSGDNKIEFQRKQDFFYAEPSLTLPDAPNNSHATNHTFDIADRPYVIALQDTTSAGGGTITQGTIYRMHMINTSNGNAQLHDLEGNRIPGMIGNRGTNWELAVNAGQSYVTFHTANDTTTNNDLFLDTSFKKVGAQINDATIAR